MDWIFFSLPKSLLSECFFFLNVMYLYFSSSEVGLFHQAAAHGFPSIVSAFYSPQSEMCLYWSVAGRLLTTCALMLHGLETVQKLSFLSNGTAAAFLGCFFVFFFLLEGQKGRAMHTNRTLIRRSSPGCIKCPAAQHISSARTKRWK